MIHTAVIGFGRWGRHLVRNVRECPLLRLVAVCDVDPQQLSDVPAELRAPDLWSMPDRGLLDAVIIATPPSTHAALCRHALSAGLHVLCEKPLAMSAAECRALGELADQHNRILMVDCTPAWLAEVRTAAEEIRQEQISQIRCLRTSTRMPRDAAELLWDLAPHDLGVLWSWFGGLPADWECRAFSRQAVSLTGAYDGGPVVELTVGWSDSPEREITLASSGGRRTIRQRQQHPEPLQVVVSHFAECIRHGTPPLIGATAAENTARVLSQVIRRHVVSSGPETGLNHLTELSLSTVPFTPVIRQQPGEPA